MPPYTGQRTDETFKAGELHYLDLSNLPTDQSELRTLIEERRVEGGPSGDWETFAIIGDLLRETYASPELRSALYQVAANLPGVELPSAEVRGYPFQSAARKRVLELDRCALSRSVFWETLVTR